MSGTSVWLPILSAVAALLGAGVGAMLQGRYGVTGWRRQTRLEAYTKFLDATHDFNYLLDGILSTISESDFDERLQNIRAAVARLRSTATSASIAGPKSINLDLNSILRNANAVIGDMQNRDTFMSIVHDWRKGKVYDKWETWVQSTEQFLDSVQTILKTDK